MAAAAGWDAFTSDVQQLMGFSSSGHKQSEIISQLDPSSVRQCQQPVSDLTTPSHLLHTSETQLPIDVSLGLTALYTFCDIFLQQNQQLRQSHMPTSSSSSSNPLPDICLSALQLPHAPWASNVIDRAFQLRNDSDILVNSRKLIRLI
jgi:hypothetical protein